MTNNEKFNALLNSCSDPRRTYDALMALASLISESKCAAQETFYAQASEVIPKLKTV